MINIFFKEINGFLYSLIAYVVIGVFLTALGLLMWVFPESNVLDYGFADMTTLFSLGPFVLMFLAPAITMRSVAEEVKTGTIELIAVKPIRTLDIILGKYLAAMSLTLFAILPTLVYYITLYQLSSPVGNLDTAGIIGSYFGLLLLSSVFISIGILSSSSTENQVISFISASFISFLLFTGINSLANIDVWSNFSLFISSLSLEYHYNAMSRGVIDTRDVLYFISVDILFLYLSVLILKNKR